MRDLGCHPDLFRLAVVIKKKKKEIKIKKIEKQKKRGGVGWGREGQMGGREKQENV